MKPRETSECPNCKPIARRLAKLEQQLAAALQRIDKLEQENSRLRDENAPLKQQLAAARKDSSTSSKPPSSDIVKPKKPPRKAGQKRKRGGQPGHKRHERPRFPLDMIDETLPYVTAEHFALVYEACNVAVRPKHQRYQPADWWRALITFAYMTGWRVGEPLALRWDDVSLDDATAITCYDDNKGEAR